jgi:hypothetical protein
MVPVKKLEQKQWLDFEIRRSSDLLGVGELARRSAMLVLRVNGDGSHHENGRGNPRDTMHVSLHG